MHNANCTCFIANYEYKDYRIAAPGIIHVMPVPMVPRGRLPVMGGTGTSTVLVVGRYTQATTRVLVLDIDLLVRIIMLSSDCRGTMNTVAFPFLK